MRRRGFSLLEVMVALSILALALVAISGVNANAFESSNYARYVTVATSWPAARCSTSRRSSGRTASATPTKNTMEDFDAEGYPGVKWNAVCRPVEVDVNQLLGGLFGGEVGTDNLPDTIKDFVGAMNGSGDKKAVDSIAGSDLSKVLGGGGLELIQAGRRHPLQVDPRDHLGGDLERRDLQGVAEVRGVRNDQRPLGGAQRELPHPGGGRSGARARRPTPARRHPGHRRHPRRDRRLSFHRRPWRAGPRPPQPQHHRRASIGGIQPTKGVK